MRVKRFMPWLVAALAAASLAGVGSSLAGTSHQAKPAAAIKVGLVTDIGGLNDRGFNHLAYLGLQTGIKQLGVRGRVLTSSGPNEYIPNFTSLVKQHYDLIIGVGFLQTDAITIVAKKFPGTKFAIVDVDATFLKGAPKNVQGILFKEQEVGYEVGYLAALEAKRLGKDTVSSVGGIKIPPVDRFIAGYQAGAKAAVRGTKTLNAYSQDFVAQDKCKEIALNQIAQGSVVVFQVAGGCGLGALDAAKEKGVWGIGVDNDQSFIGPQVLTSAVKRVEVGVFQTIRSVVKGTYAGGTNAVYGVKDGGVGFGKVSPKVPAAEVAALKAVAAKISAGSLTIPTTVP